MQESWRSYREETSAPSTAEEWQWYVVDVRQKCVGCRRRRRRVAAAICHPQTDTVNHPQPHPWTGGTCINGNYAKQERI